MPQQLDAQGEVALSPERLFDVVRTLGGRFTHRQAVNVIYWLFLKHRGLRPGRTISFSPGDCLKFAEVMFGCKYSEEHRHFNPLQLHHTPWPASRGTNTWPYQTIWTRLNALSQQNKLRAILADHDSRSGYTEVTALPEHEYVKGFMTSLLRAGETADGYAEGLRLPGLELAEWFTRYETYSHPPSDSDIVTAFASAFHVVRSEHVFFDEPSRTFLIGIGGDML